MKEKILNTFATMGFQLEEMEGFGYGFRYEGINYLYMPNDDDEDFLNLAIPAILEVTEDNTNADGQTEFNLKVRKGQQTW